MKCESDGSLTNHPAKKQVMDFLKNLVVDSLSLPPASKGPHTIDLLLEVCQKRVHVNVSLNFPIDKLNL